MTVNSESTLVWLFASMSAMIQSVACSSRAPARMEVEGIDKGKGNACFGLIHSHQWHGLMLKAQGFSDSR